jgi:hypothetical protein
MAVGTLQAEPTMVTPILKREECAQTESTPARENPVVITDTIPVVENLSYREFVHEYQRYRKPVLIKDATANWAARNWTLESLAKKVGHREVKVRTEAGEHIRKMEDILPEIAQSTIEHPAVYARNIDVERHLPELWGDVSPRLKYAKPDWKSSALLPKDFIFPNGLEELFIGGVGASFPRLHIDYWGMDGFVNQMYGRKEFILISPADTACVYPDPKEPQSSLVQDMNHPDLEKFPLFQDARVQRVMLEPGDTLYNPGGWWHTTYMPETSITVITATWHQYNWKSFMYEYRRRANVCKLHKATMLAWLAAVGGIHRLHQICSQVKD